MNIHEFDPVIYPYKIWVVVGEKVDEIPDSFLGYDGKEIENIKNDTSNLEAFAMSVMDKEKSKYGAIIYFINKRIMTCGVIAHESSHAAKLLFEHISADCREHEPFEYLLGWIADCCHKVKKAR